jgi:hypothetical protein
MLINLIPFNVIISVALEKYINKNQNLFINNNNIYILTMPFKINIMHSYITNTINSMISQLTSSNIYIIGECYLFNNWRLLLEYNQINLDKKQLLDNNTVLKYLIKEANIKIDELRLNHIADAYFNKQFKNIKNNIKFLKHRNLTEDDIIYIFKCLFSEKNLNIIENTTILTKLNDLIYTSKSNQMDKKYIKIISSLLEEQLNNR